MTLVYISGPMTGYPNYNYPAFFDAEERLRDSGFDVVNPARHEDADLPEDPQWPDFMRVAMRALSRVDMVAVLPRADASRGANCEVAWALDLGLPTVPLQQVLSSPHRFHHLGEEL